MNETAELKFIPLRTEHVIFEDETVTQVQIVAWQAAEPSSCARMRLIEASGTLEFWDAEGEDIYTSKDGQPLDP